MRLRWKAAVLAAGSFLAASPLFMPQLFPGSGLAVNTAIAFGFFVGVLSGGLGMGGVWLMVPLMTYLFSLDIKAAIGTALTAQVIITLVGSYEHFRQKSTGVGVAIPLIVGGVFGTPIGVYLNVLSSETLLNWMYAVLLAGIGLKMGYELLSKDGHAEETDGRDLADDMVGKKTVSKVTQPLRDGVGRVGRVGEAVETRIPSQLEDDYKGHEYSVDTLSLFVAGVGFGVVNSLLGTSSTLVVPFLDVFMRLSTHVATLVSLFNVTAISIPASLNHMFVGNVQYLLAAVVGVTGAVGAVLSSDISEELPERAIQVAVTILLFALAYYMLPIKPF
jgi:uncharacterized membrane protein YfcA